MTTQFRISLFDSKQDNLAKPIIVTLDTFIDWIKNPQIRMDKDGALFSPATFQNNKRLKVNVKELSMLVVDCDGALPLQEALEIWNGTGLLGLFHTTWSHGRVCESNPSGADKWRGIIPFEKPATPEQFERAWKWAQELFKGALDSGARDTSRMSYLPSKYSQEAPYESLVLGGELLSSEFPGPDSVIVNQQSFALAVLAREVELVRTAPQGERNTRLTKAGYSTGGFISTGDLDSTTVYRELENAAIEVGLPAKEIVDTLTRAIRAGMALPRVPPKERVDDWAPPVQVRESEPLPKFPLECLPPWLSRYAGEVSIETQVPREAAALFGLAVLSATVAPDVQVRVRGNWIEPINLYAILALLPAQRKSAVWSAMVKPLQVYEAKIIKESRPIIAKEKAARMRRLSRLERLKRQLYKETVKSKQEEIEKELEALALQIDLAGEPVAPQLIVDDITPETLATVMAQQGGSIALLSAEGGLFDQLAGRYTDGLVNIDIFLKGHSGDMLKINRRDRSETIESPRLTMALAVQPAVLRAAAQKPEFRQRGLLARFLYSMPESNLGSRLIAPQEALQSTREGYFEAITTLKTSPKMAFISLTEEADQKLQAWEAQIEKTICPGGSHAEISDWQGKLAGQTVRLAALLHLGWNAETLSPWPEKISGETMEQAILLAQYFQIAAQDVFQEMRRSRHLEDVKAIVRFARERSSTPIASFSARDVRQFLRRRFSTMEHVKIVLDFMLEESWIIERQGSRKTVFEVAPVLPPEIT